MGKLNSFVKQTIAKIKGDEAQVTAEKNYRKAVSLIKGQLSSLGSKIELELNDRLEAAKEAFEDAKYPTEALDGNNYLLNLKRKKEAVDSAQEELDNTNASIEYYKGLLTEFDKES